MRGQMQAGSARLVTAPARGRLMLPGPSRARQRQDERVVVIARLDKQRRDVLRADAGRPGAALRRLPY